MMRLMSFLLSISILFSVNSNTINMNESHTQLNEGYSHSTGNIANFSFAANSNEYVYFINYNDGSKIYRLSMDNKKIEKVSDFPADELHIMNDKIYYGNIEDNSSIYSVDLSGSNNKKLNNQISGFINVMDSNIIYGAYPNYEIQSMSLNDLSTLVINDHECYFLQVHGGKLYYVDLSNNLSLNSYDLSSNSSRIVFEEQVGSYMVDNSGIYYMKNSKIFRSDHKGDFETYIMDFDGFSFNVHENHIFYVVNGVLAKYDIAKKENTIIKTNLDKSMKYINVIENLLFIKNDMNNKIVIVSVEGDTILED